VTRRPDWERYSPEAVLAEIRVTDVGSCGWVYVAIAGEDGEPDAVVYGSSESALEDIRDALALGGEAVGLVVTRSVAVQMPTPESLSINYQITYRALPGYENDEDVEALLITAQRIYSQDLSEQGHRTTQRLTWRPEDLFGEEGPPEPPIEPQI